MCVCVLVCVFVSVCVSAYLCGCICSCMCLCMCVYLRVGVVVCVRMCMHVLLYVPHGSCCTAALQSVSIYRIYSPISRFKYKPKCNCLRKIASKINGFH